MKFSRDDLLTLRWQLLMIAAAALLGGALYFYSDSYASQAQHNMHSAQRQFSDARNRLNTAQQDRENLGSYQSQYAALEKARLIGDDQRLGWLEGLEKIRDQNLVLDFRYNIAPQKTYAPKPAIDSGNFEIHFSEMKLQFDLLHEGQLISFFDALRANIKGRYQLEGCTMQRLTGSAQLKAECNGGWITLKNRNTPS
jgi:hypothetical protein